jgi:hypothetical protein
MYTYIEINSIFSCCNSIKELQHIKEAFSLLIKDGDVSNKKIFFIRKKERLKKMELET